MSVYVSDKEMEALRELYDFYSTSMEGVSLEPSGQVAYDEMSSVFWGLYEKCKKDRGRRDGAALVRRVLASRP